MKPLLTLTLAIISLSSFAQTDSATTVKAVRPNMATLQFNDGTKTKGWFYSINDSQFTVLPRSVRHLKQLNSLSTTSYSYPIEQIHSIRLRKKNSGLKGALIGFGIGAVTGVVIGFASGDDPIATAGPNDFWGIGAAIQNAFAMTAEEKALAGGIGLGVSGALTGAVIGALIKKKFIIGGSRKVARDLNSDLMKRLMIQQ